MAKRKMKCKLVRLCPDEVIVKKAHLREDIHEARVGIQRDERALGLAGLGNIIRTSYTVTSRLSHNIYGEPVSTYDIVDHRGHVVEADFLNYWDAYNRANHLTAVNRELLRMSSVEAQIAEKRRARAREASTTELWELDF